MEKRYKNYIVFFVVFLIIYEYGINILLKNTNNIGALELIIWVFGMLIILDLIGGRILGFDGLLLTPFIKKLRGKL